MSAMKEILLDYMETKGKYNYDEFTSNDFYKIQTTYFTPTPTTPVPPLVIDFFNSVIPKSDSYKRYIMLLGKTGCANYKYKTDEEFIAGYSKYAPLLTDTFFSPCLYDGWWESVNACLCNVIFLDIDGITDVNLLTMSTTEISDWLTETYNIPSHLLPDWCICPGHGIHLYFVVDEMDYTDTEQGKLRDYYTDMLICYFHADVSCSNRNHILRLPFSYNCKNSELWTPIGYGSSEANGVRNHGYRFEGAFDGHGHTISNLSINECVGGSSNSEAATGVGLFGATFNATIKNLKIKNASVTGNHFVAAVVGHARGTTIENVHVEDVAISCIYADPDESGDKAGAIVAFIGISPEKGSLVKGNTAKNSTINAARDAGQIIGCFAILDITNTGTTNRTVQEDNIAYSVVVTDNNETQNTDTSDNIKNEIFGRVVDFTSAN